MTFLLPPQALRVRLEPQAVTGAGLLGTTPLEVALASVPQALQLPIFSGRAGLDADSDQCGRTSCETQMGAADPAPEVVRADAG